MKNRKILIVLLAMLLIVSAVGCAAKQPAETAAPAETKTDAPAEPAQTEETGAYVIGFNNYNMGSDFPQQLYAGLEAADFLTAHPDSRKILFGVLTDPASAGVLAAIETAKRSDDCMIVSHGGEDVGIEMLKKDNCFQGTVCYDPAKYGEGLIPLAVRIIHGEQAEVYNYAQQYMLTRDNLG